MILCNFEADHRLSTTQSLKKSDLKDFISILFDTTVATSNSGHDEQFLDIFYGTLILCMIRFVLFLAFRYSTDDYKPFGLQANHDPTFLNGSNSQLYLPMLYSLARSQPTVNADLLLAGVAIDELSTIRLSTRSLPIHDMSNQASRFIEHYSRDCDALKSCLSGLD